MGLDQCQAHKKEGDYVSKECLGVAQKRFKKERERDTQRACGHVHNVSVEEFARLVEAARVGGAKEACEGESEQQGRLRDSVSEETVDKKKDEKAQKAVHLVENLPPLPAKLVEMIQEGSFVDFSWFPVLEDGPSDGEWRNYASESGEGGPSGVGTGKKRKLWNEVPDVSRWGTCFSLFQMAWA